MRRIIKFSCILTWLIIPSSLQCCISIAKLSDLPQSSNSINFGNYSNEFDEDKMSSETRKTSYEYFLEIKDLVPEQKLIVTIPMALDNLGYEVIKIDTFNNSVFGSRGLRGYEWKTVTGVYYNINSEFQITQVYFLSKITQDITGGRKINRAKKVATELEGLLSN